MTLSVIGARVADIILFFFFVVTWCPAMLLIPRTPLVTFFLISMLVIEMGQTIFTFTPLVLTSIHWMDRLVDMWLFLAFFIVEAHAVCRLHPLVERDHGFHKKYRFYVYVGFVLLITVQLAFTMMSVLSGGFATRGAVLDHMWNVTTIGARIVCALGSLALFTSFMWMLIVRADCYPYALYDWRTAFSLLCTHFFNVVLLIWGVYYGASGDHDGVFVMNVLNTKVVGTLMILTEILSELFVRSVEAQEGVANYQQDGIKLMPMASRSSGKGRSSTSDEESKPATVRGKPIKVILSTTEHAAGASEPEPHVETLAERRARENPDRNSRRVSMSSTMRRECEPVDPEEAHTRLMKELIPDYESPYETGEVFVGTPVVEHDTFRHSVHLNLERATPQLTGIQQLLRPGKGDKYLHVPTMKWRTVKERPVDYPQQPSAEDDENAARRNIKSMVSTASMYSTDSYCPPKDPSSVPPVPALPPAIYTGMGRLAAGSPYSAADPKLAPYPSQSELDLNLTRVPTSSSDGGEVLTPAPRDSERNGMVPSAPHRHTHQDHERDLGERRLDSDEEEDPFKYDDVPLH